jgi:DNA-binding transcriptional regulator GbsR (MarR family)
MSAVEDAGEQLAAELAAQGFPRMPARVIMAITVSEEGRLTAAELAERLDASPAAISGAVRYLQTIDLLRATTVPGTRKHVYGTTPVPWYAASLNQDRWGHMIEALDRALVDLPPGSARERIEEMTEFFRYLQAELPRLWERWRDSRQPSS